MVANTPPERQTMTGEERARRLGIGRTTCYAAVRAGVIPAIRILGRVVISRAVMDRLLADDGLPRSGNSTLTAHGHRGSRQHR